MTVSIVVYIGGEARCTENPFANMFLFLSSYTIHFYYTLPEYTGNLVLF